MAPFSLALFAATVRRLIFSSAVSVYFRLNRSQGLTFFFLETAKNISHPTQPTEQEQTQAEAVADTIEQAPKQIATGITSFLRLKGIHQRFFARKILNRAQGTFSDYLSNPPPHMPATHGRATWLRLQEFLANKEQQEELLRHFKRGNIVF